MKTGWEGISLTVEGVNHIKSCCGNCKRFIGGGDWGLCCQVDYGLHYEDSDACHDYEPKED